MRSSRSGVVGTDYCSQAPPTSDGSGLALSSSRGPGLERNHNWLDLVRQQRTVFLPYHCINPQVNTIPCSTSRDYILILTLWESIK